MSSSPYTWQHHIHHQIAQIEHAAPSLRTYLLRINLPYCAYLTGAAHYILLNRLYKPLTLSSRDFVDYDAPQFDWLRLPPTFATASCQHLSGSANRHTDEGLWFYSDGNPPYLSKKNRQQYIERLQKLIRMV